MPEPVMAWQVWLSWLFWVSIGLVVYAQALYPALMISLVRPRARTAPAEPHAPAPDRSPQVACIVAAYNEERHVSARVENFLAQRYPADKIGVLIGSDGSSDRTAALLQQVTDPRVLALHFAVNRGKASVLNDLVARTQAPILVFSDANTLFEPDALQQLVRHFDDPSVGAVCGELRLLDSRGDNQDSAYWRIEQALKRSEAAIGGLLGANGAIYAMRRELYVALRPDTIVDDFCIAMSVSTQGYRLVYEPLAVALEDTPDDISDEYVRRVRIGIGNYQAFFRHPEYLLRTNWSTRLTYLSHKVLRWFTPHLLALALLASTLLAIASPFASPVYGVLAAAQWALYLIFFAWQSRGMPLGLPKLVKLLFFFLTLNVAFAVAFWRFLTGRYSGSWRRTERA